MSLQRIAGTALPYFLSIALAKGVSLALVPWIAAHLPPAEYGRIEVVGSLVEFAGIFFAFGLADTLFRFVGAADVDSQRRERTAAIAGTAMLIALVCAALLQALAGTILDVMPVRIDPWAFRLSLLAASVGGTIELPLAWLRLGDRPMAYLGFCALRALLQLVGIGWAVAVAPRAESVLAATAVVEIVVASTLVVSLVRETGLRLTVEAAHWIASYSLPLMAGSIATFVVGSFDRWFLSSHVATAALGHYGIANKVALATSLLMQPFGLWWYARRMRVLAEPDGLARSADAVATGFVILIAGAVVACLAGPAFVRLALPAAYAPAVSLVPGLVAVSFLNETASLLNVGCYARRTTVHVTLVNLIGASVALAGYCTLIPRLGVEGAIIATLAAHLARIAGFLTVGHSSARIPYRAGPIVALGLAAAVGIVLGMHTESPPLQIGAAFFLPVALAGAARLFGLIRLPQRGGSTA